MDVMVVDHPSGMLSPPTHLRRDKTHLHLHLRSPRPYRTALDAAMLTPWGRLKLATDEDAWELRKSHILADPQGLLEQTRSKVIDLLSHRNMGRARVAATISKLATLERHLAGLARITDNAGRARMALTFARGLFALGGRDEYAGLIALTLRLASQLAGGQVLRWYLVDEALRGVRHVLPNLNLTLALAQAMGVVGLDDDQVGEVTLANLRLVRSEVGGTPSPSAQEIANLDRYERMVAAGLEIPALLLLRGEASRWLGKRPAYLAVCDLIMPEPGADPASVWPQLLSVLSTWLATAQALRARASSPDLPFASA